MTKVRALYSLLLVLAVAGCGTYLVPRREKARDLAEAAGWTYAVLPAGDRAAASALAPGAGRGGILTVYLEGDGLAFLGPRTVSPDPTPTDPLALRLALAHPGGAAWLARPCQFGTAAACTPLDWTTHRYSPAMVAAVDDAVGRLKAGAGAPRLILAGYSGGGALAVLIAARRDDVAALVTVAANLDVTAWTTSEGLTPLSGSLDPADHAGAVAGLPQVHFVGGRDDVVPARVTRAFAARLGAGGPASVIERPDFTHECCWVEDWPRLARDGVLTRLPDRPPTDGGR